MPSPSNSIEIALNELCELVHSDPLSFVMYFFPWQTDPSIQVCELAPQYRERFPGYTFGPDIWACEFLDQFGEEIKKRKFDGRHAVEPVRFATVSGHGIGKSTIVAWLVLFIMNTRPMCRGTVTASTDTQLRSKTWAEVGKWHSLSITKHRYDWTSSRGNMRLVNRKFPERWFCQAQTSKEENSESFAGQHAADSTSFYIFDEASAIPSKIFEVRQGGLTDGEPMVFDFGNGTRNSGEFYEELEGRLRHRYIGRHIDSRSVAITNKTEAQEMIDDFGLDSDRVRVRILGQFPKMGNAQFISDVLVRSAQNAKTPANNLDSALVIGVDPAEFGDDTSVIYPRFGNDARTWGFERYSGLDPIQLAGKVIAMIERFQSLGIPTKGIFVDGGGVGSGVIAYLQHLHFPATRVMFGGGPVDQHAYRYKVDEMWGKLRDALKNGLAIPTPVSTSIEDPGEVLRLQLTAREYATTVNGAINLESKVDLKKRGFESPDVADALALTYAVEIAPTIMPEHFQSQTAAMSWDYDPLETRL